VNVHQHTICARSDRRAYWLCEVAWSDENGVLVNGYDVRFSSIFGSLPELSEKRGMVKF
jgi:hypothetical protein